MLQLKLFISYSSKDSRLAGLFKECFENYAGFSVFLAHEDIAPALDWELKIVRRLRDSDVVIPLITKNYHTSEFTDQELGMALAWKKTILPIKLSDINPYGFIKRTQALKCRCNDSDVIHAVLSIVLALIENKEFNKFKEIVIDSVIQAFSRSSSFYMTRTIIRILTKISHFTDAQIVGLKKAVKINDQIFQELYAYPDFKRILKEKHNIIIDS